MAGIRGTFYGCLLWFLIGTAVPVEFIENCPAFCFCDTWYELRRASCIGRHLYSIHTGASHDVQALDLSNNSISYLGNFELAYAGLKELRYLNLSGNSINEIDLNAFGDLRELTVLDLSYNHLYYLLSDVFVENGKLRIVKLSGNNFNSNIMKLRSPHITTLTLASCRISHIPPDTFRHLPSLMNLDLSNNLMIQIDWNLFLPLRYLKMLSLEGNPWSCNTVLSRMQAYLNRRNIEFGSICGLTGKPKTFEKMIIAPTNNVNHRQSTTKIVKTANETLNNTNIPRGENKTTSSIIEVSPYWFLAIGFIVGSAVTLVISYIWLHKSIYCSQNYTGRERIATDSQRLSLLSSLWQYEDGAASEGPSISRGGTPPPAYREVMLRPSLYGCPSSMHNFNDNAARRERFA